MEGFCSAASQTHDPVCGALIPCWKFTTSDQQSNTHLRL